MKNEEYKKLSIKEPFTELLDAGCGPAPTRDVVMKCCRKAGLTVEKFEIRKAKKEVKARTEK